MGIARRLGALTGLQCADLCPPTHAASPTRWTPHEDALLAPQPATGCIRSAST
jgi:hypothetical protein